jgi:putative addiction module component (TIGR02574 family)
MTRAVADIERDIRALTAQDREQLLRLLITQLDEPSDAGVDQAWRIESERRVAEIESGSAKVVPGTQVMEEARKYLKSIK